MNTAKLTGQGYEARIRQICSIPSIEEVENTADAPVDLTVFICFTNRSGSNFLASLLAATGNLPTGREIFNITAVSDGCQQRDIRRLDTYCRFRVRQQARNRRFAAKVGLEQLLTLGRVGYLGTIFPNPHFIHIQRYDLIGQSISLTVAMQNRAFNSEHTPSLRDEDLQYDRHQIEQRMKAITTSNLGFQQFLLRNRLPTFPLLYEHLTADSQASLIRIMDWLGIEMPAKLNSQNSTKPQSSAIKDTWYDRFVSDLMADP